MTARIKIELLDEIDPDKRVIVTSFEDPFNVIILQKNEPIETHVWIGKEIVIKEVGWGD